MKNNEMGCVCSMYGRQERCIRSSGGGRSKGKSYLEDIGVDGRIILKWNNWDGEAWTGLIWLCTGIIGGRFECGNGPSGSLECGGFLD
jgi:hypothetical protein